MCGPSAYSRLHTASNRLYNKPMKVSLLLIASAIAFPFSMNGKSKTIVYPSAPKDNTVDVYFGKKVADPYRPLENDTSAATAAWVEAENAVTRGYLDALPVRSKIRERLTELNNYAKYSLPVKLNDSKYYHYENDGLQNQSVLYRSETPGERGEVFIDPNKLSDDGTVALTGVFMSHDGKYTAYTISRSGSDWTEIYVLDTRSGRLLDDHINWAKFTDASWHGDGFYYSAYPTPEEGKELSAANKGHNIYYHRIGTLQSEDILVFSDPAAPLHFHQAWVDEGENVLAVSVGGQGNGNALITKSLKTPDAPWVTVTTSQDKDIVPVTVVDGRLLLLTNDSAPNYRLVSAPVANPVKESWTEVLPETENVLAGVSPAGPNLIATYDKDASNHAFVFDCKGKLIREIKLPTYGTVWFSASPRNSEVFYGFSSFVYPSALYSYDMTSGESTPLRTTSVAGLNPDDYVTEQVFYTSKDGTRVPMFLTYRKDLKRDGKNPVYLYGYGGFNITLNPGFSPNRILWIENGGIYAQANLRGGAEYGEPWHIAGTLMQKQNVFDDFIAAAEYMVDRKWTRPELITIEGGSNGGLLVGACTNQRPDLFAVAIPRVGVMDMMRYHLFTIGWNWAHDYGTSADSPEMAEYLLGYSPLHNIKNDGTPYPAIMVTTADHDDRVVPAHSFKYAATLQASDTGNAPKLIRIDSKAGHGGGKPVGKVIDEYADIYSFIFANIPFKPKCLK